MYQDVGLYQKTRVKAPIKQRVAQGFPLKPVNMTAPVGPSDFDPGKKWHPERINDRVSRLKTFDNLFEGDLL